MNYWMIRNFPLLKELSDSRNKRKAEEKMQDFFCKLLAAVLKEMNVYDMLNAQKGNKKDCFQVPNVTFDQTTIIFFVNRNVNSNNAR